MDVWNLEDIIRELGQQGIASEREAISLARWVLDDILGLKPGQEVTKAKFEQFESILHRLKNGEPAQYIAGHAWFFGYQFHVNQNVLIPRPETEELVDWVLKDLKSNQKSPLHILDIGTGSGCIAITLKKKLGAKGRVVGIDISKEALAVAKQNSHILQAEVEFLELDFLNPDAALSEPFDIIISNPPYVGKDLISAEMAAQLQYEPDLALYPKDADIDIFYRKISEMRKHLLIPKGDCYLELNEFRPIQIKSHFEENKWKHIEIRDDMQGLPRMLKANSG